MQSPQQQIAERFAEAAPGLVTAAHMAAFEQSRQAQDDYRKRVADAHAWEAAALGQTATPITEEEMGNLMVVGDIYGANAAEIVKALQGQATTPPATPTPATPTADASPAVVAVVPKVQQAVETAVEAAPAAAALAASPMPMWLKAGIAALMLGGGAVAGSAPQWGPWLFSSKPQPVVSVPTDRPPNWSLQVVPKK